MAQFWEFFTFELKFRAKSVSTYVYFLMWFAFEFFCVASESFGPVGSRNGKILLNGPWANTENYIGASFFGIIVIAAIFGTSILRDFQRDTIQILFTKPISKLAYLGGRWAGSFVATVFAFSGMLFGTFVGTLAPWADHARIGPNHLLWYLQPFFSVAVVQAQRGHKEHDGPEWDFANDVRNPNSGEGKKLGKRRGRAEGLIDPRQRIRNEASPRPGGFHLHLLNVGALAAGPCRQCLNRHGEELPNGQEREYPDG